MQNNTEAFSDPDFLDKHWENAQTEWLDPKYKNKSVWMKDLLKLRSSLDEVL